MAWAPEYSLVRFFRDLYAEAALKQWSIGLAVTWRSTALAIKAGSQYNIRPWITQWSIGLAIKIVMFLKCNFLCSPLPPWTWDTALVWVDCFCPHCCLEGTHSSCIWSTESQTFHYESVSSVDHSRLWMPLQEHSSQVASQWKGATEALSAMTLASPSSWGG